MRAHGSSKIFIPLFLSIKHDVLTLASLLVELNCPQHGLERFRIKIVKRWNMKSDTITPRFRSRPRPGELSCLLVGKNVSNRDVERYLTDYFRRKGLVDAILAMRLVL